MLLHVVTMNEPRFEVTKRPGSVKAPETQNRYLVYLSELFEPEFDKNSWGMYRALKPYVTFLKHHKVCCKKTVWKSLECN